MSQNNDDIILEVQNLTKYFDTPKGKLHAVDGVNFKIKKGFVKRLKKMNLSKIKRVSLVFIGMNPCLVFAVGMKFRGLLERFL